MLGKIRPSTSGSISYFCVMALEIVLRKPPCCCCCCLPRSTTLTKAKIRFMKGSVYQVPYFQSICLFILGSLQVPPSPRHTVLIVLHRVFLDIWICRVRQSELQLPLYVHHSVTGPVQHEWTLGPLHVLQHHPPVGPAQLHCF